ncbi:MAG: SH3 domain-containing protein [Dehalococcoidia bacterium]
MRERVAPPQRVAAPPPEPEPYYDDDEDEFDGYEPHHESFLRNPYVLAAIAVTAAIVMAIVVVVMAGGGGSGSGGNPAAISTEDPLTPRPSGAVVESIAAATVREGPGSGGELGSLPRGQKVTVTGRDSDAKWFQIVFPQNSTLRGWVPASALKVADLNVQSIAIASVTPITRSTLPPTRAPVVIATEAATSTPAATSTQVAGPDLAVTMTCAPGATVSVTIRNAGAAAVQQPASISVLIGGAVRSTNQVNLNLEPNASITVPTDQVVTAPTTSVQVALQGAADIDPSDNSAVCTVQSSTTVTPAASTPATSTPAANTPTVGPTLTATPVIPTVSP